MDFINQLLLNMLIIISSITVYQVFWVDRFQNVTPFIQQSVGVILCTVVALFCMAHPIVLTRGLQYDLRSIPFAVCLLYAGFRPSLLVAACILAYRFYFVGSSIFMLGSLVILISVGALVLCCKPLIVKQNKVKNITAATLVGLLAGIMISIVIYSTQIWLDTSFQPHYILDYSVFCVLHGLTLGLVVCIIEQIKENSQHRKQKHFTEKINVLGELAASFAHEIRNPMTVARGFMQFLKQPEVSEEKRQIYTNMVVDEIDKAQKIVNDYLTFAKPQLEAIELVDAKPLILQALQHIEPYAKLCHVEIETQLDDKLIISANSDKFTQCIMHLCKNGIEAMPNGGKLQIIATIQNRSVCIDIIDHGIGMTNEEIRRLGTPFYSTRDKGTGLGMMVTYRVIQMLQGKIDVNSELGKGTCFSLIIPSLHVTSYH